MTNSRPELPWLRWSSHGIDWHAQAAVASIVDAYNASKRESPFASEYRDGLWQAASILIMSHAGFSRLDAKRIVEYQIVSRDPGPIANHEE